MVRAAVGQVAQARRKPEAQQAAQPEAVLGRPARVGVVFPDGQGAIMVHQPVQHVGGLAPVGRDHLGLIGPKAVGEVGV